MRWRGKRPNFTLITCGAGRGRRKESGYTVILVKKNGHREGGRLKNKVIKLWVRYDPCRFSN